MQLSFKWCIRAPIEESVHRLLFEPSLLVTSLAPEASQPDRNFGKRFKAERQHARAESGAVRAQN